MSAQDLVHTACHIDSSASDMRKSTSAHVAVHQLGPKTMRDGTGSTLTPAAADAWARDAPRSRSSNLHAKHSNLGLCASVLDLHVMLRCQPAGHIVLGRPVGRSSQLDMGPWMTDVSTRQTALDRHN